MNFDQSTKKAERVVLVTVIVSLILALIGTSINGCVKSRNITKLQDEIATTTYNSVMPFTKQKLKDSTEIITQGQLIASKDAEIVRHIEKEEKLFKLASNVKINTVVQVVEKLVPYRDSVNIISVKDSFGHSDEYLKIPARAVEIDTNFRLDATVTSEGILVNHLEIPNTITINIGDEGNIFKHSPVVKVSNSNPLIITESMKNVIVKDPKMNSKSWKAFGIGTASGIVVTTVAAILLKIYQK